LDGWVPRIKKQAGSTTKGITLVVGLLKAEEKRAKS